MSLFDSKKDMDAYIAKHRNENPPDYKFVDLYKGQIEISPEVRAKMDAWRRTHHSIMEVTESELSEYGLKLKKGSDRR